MAGYIRGKVECNFTNKDLNYNCQNAFKVLYDFFTSHPQYTLIALQYGATNGPATAGAGAGTGFADPFNQGGNSFGNNAFFVVRQNATLTRPYDVYHFFQWCGGSNLTRGSTFPTAPGTPAAIQSYPFGAPNSNNNASVGYQCVIGISGSGGTTGSVGNGFGNPWRGGMNALTGTLGIDIKAQVGPVWGPPAGGGTGMMIFPRSCDGPNGSFISKAENCICLLQGTTNDNRDWRMNVVADDDSFAVTLDNTDVGTNIIAFYSGPYVPRAGMASGSQANITPWVVMGDAVDALPWQLGNEQVWGDAAGSANRQGGIVGNTTGSVRSLCIDYPGVFLNDINMQPNNTLSSSVGAGGGAYYDEMQIPVGIFETTPSQICGYLGEIDFVRWVWNVSPGVRWDFNRTWFGQPGPAGLKLSVPWDGQNKTVPRSGTTRAGTTFIRPPVSI